jgi:hypothetical protein
VSLIGVREDDLLSFRLALEESLYRIARVVYMAECYASNAYTTTVLQRREAKDVSDDAEASANDSASTNKGWGEAMKLLEHADNLMASGICFLQYY